MEYDFCGSEEKVYLMTSPNWDSLGERKPWCVCRQHTTLSFKDFMRFDRVFLEVVDMCKL